MTREQQSVVLLLGLLFLAFFSATSPPSFLSGAFSSRNSLLPAVTPPGGEEVWVEVAGSVRKRGIYRLEKGASVLAAVQKAGGTAGKTVLEPESAARRIDGNLRIGIEEKERSARAHLSPLEPAKMKALSIRVNVNTAGPEELGILPGIGPHLARAIVDFREARGEFLALEDLLKVRGLGPKKFAAIRSRLTLAD